MDFSLQSHLDAFYAQFPEGQRQPVIGLTANYNDSNEMLAKAYYEQVIRAGGTPLLIPPTADRNVIVSVLDHIDGLLLTGGADVNPLWVGEEPSPRLHNINARRDLSELLLTRLAANRQIPILGICRGIQVLAMALDGTVQQDIYEDYLPTGPSGPLRPSTIKHSQDAEQAEATHTVRIEAGSVLASLYNKEKIAVNSFHHQAVKSPGPRFRTTATAADGVIEAIESTEFKSVMGVQWHPEHLGLEGLKLFGWLVGEASAFAKAKAVHQRVLTLDTHCDTPMFFPQGVEFAQRDPRILVDLHKMSDGRQDAVTMAAYLPQPEMGQSFSSKVDLQGIARHNPALAARYITSENRTGNETPSLSISPSGYADLVFDKIEEIVEANQPYLSIARCPADLYEDKRKGRKSVLFAIENGLALDHNLANVKHFAQRGVTYITLCHNGDNDLCDSARGCHTHNGVSPFGAQVIQEMNRCGIMVDLSHAAEQSFWDALELSEKPIVCSHANCRALCDHPRNLTDDQLRALAKAGGVAHITLYHGFLRQDGVEATVLDALAHLEHAIRLMGIDHVGIGTDFDGDGGVRGFADASEVINFTRHLLSRRYSERDIEKIWGGNWLRVMSAVQRDRIVG